MGGADRSRQLPGTWQPTCLHKDLEQKTKEWGLENNGGRENKDLAERFVTISTVHILLSKSDGLVGRRQMSADAR